MKPNPKQVFECRTSHGQLLKKRLMYLFPAVVFIATGIAMLLLPEMLEGEEELLPMMLLLFFGVGAMFILLSILRVKPSSAVIYEDCLVHACGSKAMNLAFDNVKGISDETTVFLLWHIIPVGKTREITLVRKDGEKKSLTKNLVPSFNQFADALGAALATFLLKDLTKETIGSANISFGNALELSDGKFIYDGGRKKGKVSIPVDAVRSIEVHDEEGYWLTLRGRPNNEDGKAEELAMIRKDKALNIEALYRIVAMFSAN